MQKVSNILLLCKYQQSECLAVNLCLIHNHGFMLKWPRAHIKIKYHATNQLQHPNFKFTWNYTVWLTPDFEREVFNPQKTEVLLQNCYKQEVFKIWLLHHALPKSQNCRTNVAFSQLWTLGIQGFKLKEKGNVTAT